MIKALFGRFHDEAGRYIMKTYRPYEDCLLRNARYLPSLVNTDAEKLKELDVAMNDITYIPDIHVIGQFAINATDIKFQLAQEIKKLQKNFKDNTRSK